MALSVVTSCVFGEFALEVGARVFLLNVEATGERLKHFLRSGGFQARYQNGETLPLGSFQRRAREATQLLTSRGRVRIETTHLIDEHTLLPPMPELAFAAPLCTFLASSMPIAKKRPQNNPITD